MRRINRDQFVNIARPVISIIHERILMRKLSSDQSAHTVRHNIGLDHRNLECDPKRVDEVAERWE